LEFITGYVIEYALSVDNIFVMVLIFTAFNVDEKYYHRVLFWGIIGAVIMRFMFIFLGSTLINEFGWIMYIFGAFLIYTGIGMFISRDEEEKIDTENHKVVRFASRHFSVYPEYVGNKFFIKVDGAKMVTPLFIVLLIVEFTDLIFAVDSIPAIFAVTKDPYIVFFSNIFAILGLRSMFFLLVNVIHKFHYLKVGLAFLLVFIGVKMLAHHWLDLWGFTTMHSLFVILLILTTSIVGSLVFPKKG
jgi:tellurite resistance protein TerC